MYLFYRDFMQITIIYHSCHMDRQVELGLEPTDTKLNTTFTKHV